MRRVEVTRLRILQFGKHIPAELINGVVRFILSRARGLVRTRISIRVLGPRPERVLQSLHVLLLVVLTRPRHEFSRVIEYPVNLHFLELYKGTVRDSPIRTPIFFSVKMSMRLLMRYLVGSGVFYFPLVKSYLLE